jgi:hypothetical protein
LSSSSTEHLVRVRRRFGHAGHLAEKEEEEEEEEEEKLFCIEY